MSRHDKHSATSRPRLFNLILLALAAPGMATAATLTVDSTADVIANGDGCGLREAIINANNNDQSGSTDCPAGDASPVTDQILFDAATDNTPFVLDLVGASENSAATGDLDISDDLSIEGNGADSVTEVDGNATDRVFEVRNGAAVQMSRLAVTNGGAVADGAGIKIFSGSLELTDAGVLSNDITGGPGFEILSGAGVQTLGDLTLTRVSVLGNGIQGSGDASGEGAGINVGSGGTLNVVESLISNNDIDTVDESASGAGLFNHPATGSVSVTISGSVITGNHASTSGAGAASGGGINHQSGTLVLSGVLLRNNRASRASAGGNASGGGMTAFAPVELRNTTVSGNRSESIDSSTGGGLSLSGTGSLNNVTITDNQVVADPGEFALAGGISGGSSVTLGNSIIAGNTTSDGAPDCSGSFASAGYNLLGDNTNCGLTAGTGDQVGDVAGGDPAINPMLAALADNGGGILIDGTAVPVETHALQEGSPAIDGGDPNTPGAGGTCETTDQRGETRPADGDGDGSAVCDIGAFELAAPGGGGGSGGGGSLALISLALLGLSAGLVSWRRRSDRPAVSSRDVRAETPRTLA